MLMTLFNLLLSIVCLLWYIFAILIISLVSRDRELVFNMTVSCVRDIFEMWGCDMEAVIFRLNQIKTKSNKK